MVFLKVVPTDYQVIHKTQLFGTINYPPFRHSTKNQVLIPALDSYFFAKIRIEITNIWCGVSGNLSEQEWWCQNGQTDGANGMPS